MENENSLSGNAFSFDKAGYVDAQTIGGLYYVKLHTLLRERKEAELSGEERKVYLQLQRAMFYDPRLPDVYFGSKEAADKARQIAGKLHRMTAAEFLAGDYPYLWVDELAGERLLKILNPSVLSPAAV